MKEILQHPTYGEIVYDENIWTGKKTLTVNGTDAMALSKKEYLVDGKKAVLKGNVYTGISLCIESETIDLSEKPKWYEVLLAILPFMFILVWGNNVTLCSIFPVIGGGLGGALGALGSLLSLLYMKKAKSPVTKVLIGLGACAVTALVAFISAIVYISLIL